jgi:hypothetical protein
MRQQWEGLAAQALTLAQAAQVAGVFACVTAACVAVNTLSYASPLQHANIARAASQESLMPELRPKLTMQLCPYCSLVRQASPMACCITVEMVSSLALRLVVFKHSVVDARVSISHLLPMR